MLINKTTRIDILITFCHYDSRQNFDFAKFKNHLIYSEIKKIQYTSKAFKIKILLCVLDT